ncbi:NRAMP family, partial [Chlamydoabsidia padenii]
MPIQKLVKAGTYLRRLAKYIGPGFMIAVGYLDPGNWSVDFLGGSQFGYTLLFVILISNLIAIFLQNLAIRLGTVSGLDLAAASRQHLSQRLNLFLYILAEIAIIATDVAEVIGSAIALTLLFPSLSLPMGVAITAADVFIILLFYKEENNNEEGGQQHDMRAVQYFEWFVMVLVSAVGVCFVIELTLSPVVFGDVMRGFLPSPDIIKDPECLYVAIGIIGATVMPHNLFLHSFIVQSRCHVWRSDRPVLVEKNHNNNNFTASIKETDSIAEHVSTSTEGTVIIATEHHKQHQQNMTELRHHLATHVNANLHYSFIDLIVALFFAFFINTAILVVASANFHQTTISATSSMITDLFDAHDLLEQYIGRVAAFVFAIALLCAGQSSTLTATLAGQ